MSEKLSSSRNRPHVHIAEETASPQHTFVERIHTPTRVRPAGEAEPANAAEWDAEKHAHISDRTISPHGVVKRQLTPINQTSGTFESIEEQEKKATADGQRPSSALRRRGKSPAPQHNVHYSDERRRQPAAVSISVPILIVAAAAIFGLGLVVGKRMGSS